MTLGRSLACFLASASVSLVPILAAAAPAEPCGGSDTPPCVCEIVPLGVTPPEHGFVLGGEYVLMSGHGSGRKGAYDVLDLPPCPTDPCDSASGAGAIRCLAFNGYPCCLDSMTTIRVVPGNKSGSLLDGLRARWQADTDQRSGIRLADYHGNGLRLVNVLVVVEAGSSKRAVVTTGRLARFFLVNLPGRSSDDLTGEFTGYFVSGP
jgi:hypothetical protein